MWGLIMDWCIDKRLNPDEYTKETRAGCLQSIRELAEKEGCLCINNRIHYGRSLLAIVSIQSTKARELIRESFGLSNQK